MRLKASFALVLLPLIASCALIFKDNPEGDNYQAYRFDGGTMWVSHGDCPPISDTTRDTLIDWANRGYRDWIKYHPSFFMNHNHKLWVRGANITEQGKYDPKRNLITFRCDKPEVIRHELFHAYCYFVQPGCDCFWIDHPEGKSVEDCHG
jgi:hypothetical protein